MLDRDSLHAPALTYAHRDYARVNERHTVSEAMDAIRAAPLENRVVYFYVTDDQGRLLGVAPTRRLLLAAPESRVADIMVRRFVALPVDATLLDACELFILHRLLALPIVDQDGRIAGIIDIDKYTDEIRELDDREASADLFQLIGVRVARLRQASWTTSYRARFPWLLCNIAGGITCAIIAGFFTEVLEQFLVVALFIPVVLALAESVSIQSLTLTLQLHVGRGPGWRSVAWELVKETPLGLLLGASCGAIVGVTAWLWRGDAMVALSVAVSIALTILAAAIFGMLAPTLIAHLQRDPKFASGPIALAVTDITTTIVYLGLATWWLL